MGKGVEGVGYIRARRALALWAANEFARLRKPVFIGRLPETFIGGQKPKPCVGAVRGDGNWLELMALAHAPGRTINTLMVAQSMNVFDVMVTWKRYCAGYVHARFNFTNQLREPIIYLAAEFSDRAVRRLAALEIEPEFNSL